jgi:putative spermidine/putrescine transport system substrate-binding protein
MLNRRYFLFAASSLTLSSLISGCSQDNALQIFFLQNSIPPQLIASFRKKFSKSRNLLLKPKTNLKELFTLLQTWQGKNQAQKKAQKFSLPSFNFNQQKQQIGDLVTIGHYWLPQAVKEESIEPISLEKITAWHKLSPLFSNLIQLNSQDNLDSQGKIWAAPYRWGFTMIAYRSDKFKNLGWTPTDWNDLGREELKHRISLLNQPREVIGLTLKKLGYSYNEKNLNNIPQLKSELIALNKQVKFYDSTNYLQPLILGDTWLALGWSSDILPIIKRYPNIKAIIPASGASLWADLWVKPKNSHPMDSEIINQWIDFCWQPESAQQIALFSNASSPLLLSLNKSDLSQDILENNLIYPEQKIIEQSEFILPLPENINEQYQQLWRQIRQV